MHALQKPQVGGHHVSRADIYDVPRHEFFGGNDRAFAVPQHIGVRRRKRAQRFQRPFCLRLLHRADERVRNDDAQNQQRVGQIRFPLHARDGKRHCRRDEQNEHHKIAELQHKFLCEARFLPLLQPIFTVNAEPLFRFGSAQSTPRVALKGFPSRLRRHGIEFCFRYGF